MRSPRPCCLRPANRSTHRRPFWSIRRLRVQFPSLSFSRRRDLRMCGCSGEGSCARVFHERPGTSGARRNGRAEPSTRAQLVFLEIFTNLPAQSGSLGRGTKRHRFVRANFRSGSVSHQDPRNRGATRRVSESCTPYPEMYERSPARGEWRGVSGK